MLSRVRRVATVICGMAFLVFATVAGTEGAQLLVGSAHTSITPDKPVGLSGASSSRVARKVENPVTATALAIESRDGDKMLDCAIMVSCDLVAIRNGVQDIVRAAIKRKMPDFDVRKVFLNATHSHTGPVMLQNRYLLPKTGIMQPKDYTDFLAERVSTIVAEAWKNRKPGGVSWALGHAVVAINRRVVYDNGRARMYGNTNAPNFRRVEGYEDHGIEMLFFWDAAKKLTALAINPACPSQEVEGHCAINADFWHDVRERIHAKYGKGIHILGWCGAAGDQSPHLMWNKRAEERMRRLRRLSRTQEIARRIVRAVDSVFDLAKKDIRTNVPFAHVVRDIKLPARIVTDKEYASYKAQYDQLAKKPKRSARDHRRMGSRKEVVDRYERQKTDRTFPMELHVLRLGDVAIATNPFELYTDYGVQIKARSRAIQTFIIQLTGASAYYLPTKRAVAGGSYSAEVYSNLVGPEGGKALVHRTVDEINALWPAKKKGK